MRDVLAFASVAAVIVVLPGPDMALVLRNGVAAGRRAALETALGINAGLLIWALAAAVGVAAVLNASATAFTALRIAGGVYLVWLGLRALRDAWRGTQSLLPREGSAPVPAHSAFRQGLLS